MKRTIVLCLAVVGIHAAKADGVDPGAAFQDAKAVAPKSWHVGSASISYSDGNSIDIRENGQVIVGKAFFVAFTKGLAPDEAKLIARFALLHELGHFAEKQAQGGKPDDIPFDIQANECEADLLASIALFQADLNHHDGDKGEEIIKSSLGRLGFLRQFVKQIDLVSDATATGDDHPSASRRALAMYFGYARAFVALGDWTDKQGPMAKQMHSMLVQIVGPVGDDDVAWARDICRAVTRSDHAMVTDLANFGIMEPSKNQLDVTKRTQSYNFSLENKEARNLHIHYIALAGIYPLGSEGDFSKYLPLTASHNVLDIPAHGVGAIEGKISIPTADASVNGIFSWFYLFDKNTPFSAIYTGKKIPHANCASNWQNLGQSPFEMTMTDMVRLALSGKSRFESELGDPISPGTAFAGYRPKHPISGASNVYIYPALPSPWASVEIYNGNSLEEANKIYTNSKVQFNSFCNVKDVVFGGAEKQDDDKVFTADNFTADTQMWLKLSHLGPGQLGGKDAYIVDWLIFPKD